MKRRFWKRVKVVAYDCTEAGCSETTFLKNAELPTLIELREGDVVLSKDEVEKIQDLVMQFDGKTIEKTVILSIIGQAKGKSNDR